MSEIKLLCKLCGELFSPDDPNLQIVHENGGRLVALERFGRAHVLFNQRETEEHLDPPSTVEYKVRPRTSTLPEPAINDVVESAKPIAVSEIVEAEEPVTFEQIVEAQSSELYAVEPEPEIEAMPTAEEFDGHVEVVNSEFGSGFIRVVWQQRQGQDFTKVIFDKKDVVTEGEIRVGKMVRFQITHPDPGKTMYRAKEIKIYQDCGEAT
jgi:hypothetical protein